MGDSLGDVAAAGLHTHRAIVRRPSDAGADHAEIVAHHRRGGFGATTIYTNDIPHAYSPRVQSKPITPRSSPITAAAVLRPPSHTVTDYQLAGGSSGVSASATTRSMACSAAPPRSACPACGAPAVAGPARAGIRGCRRAQRWVRRSAPAARAAWRLRWLRRRGVRAARPATPATRAALDDAPDWIIWTHLRATFITAGRFCRASLKSMLHAEPSTPETFSPRMATCN